jgi:hypothetical protein
MAPSLTHAAIASTVAAGIGLLSGGIGERSGAWRIA